MTKRQLELKTNRIIYINYLQMKLNEQDWHAVADAAMDLRELEKELNVLSSRLSEE